MVTNVFAGQYQSVFKGRGMEFHEVREYLPGDEIRSIDWNVTARTGHPHVKKFVEERELTVMLLLDVSASTGFGSIHQLKSELAAELCSVLAFSAIRNNDKVGLLIFTDKIEKFIPPRKGPSHVLRIIREALYYKPQGKGTDIAGALDYFNSVTNHSAVSFIISDFYSKTNYKKMLSIANKRHDCIAVTIRDPRELELPDVGMIRLNDAETGRSYLVDTSNRSVRAGYKASSHKKFEERKKIFNSLNVDNIDIRTDIPYSKSLYRFFREREKKLR